MILKKNFKLQNIILFLHVKLDRRLIHDHIHTPLHEYLVDCLCSPQNNSYAWNDTKRMRGVVHSQRLGSKWTSTINNEGQLTVMLKFFGNDCRYDFCDCLWLDRINFMWHAQHFISNAMRAYFKITITCKCYKLVFFEVESFAVFSMNYTGG